MPTNSHVLPSSMLGRVEAIHAIIDAGIRGPTQTVTGCDFRDTPDLFYREWMRITQYQGTFFRSAPSDDLSVRVEGSHETESGEFIEFDAILCP
jgi:hypothetical protein